ncbi:MAG: single-stranded-DNA-specific exonuclease RecJ [Clostridiales bacterium]|nr:single-stranded-DNA-specific exonuclease RecJ [Clostridiales bacterium]
MKKKWIGREVDNERIKRIKEETGNNVIISALLSNRFGDDYLKEINLSVDNLTDPMRLPDMDKAIDRILEAIDNNEKVLVYGDYDADGVTATNIIYTFLKDQGLDVAYYIPNRLKEGYGLNKPRLKEFKDMGYTLTITVDTGIVAFEEALYCKEIGMDLVITDHHEVQDGRIPEAISVVDPKREECDLEFKEIAGCFVAFKLVQALSEVIGMPENYDKKFLSIVAIGTIADVMPLKSENRIAVEYGLKNIKENPNDGVRQLVKDLNSITAMNIAFSVVPKLNAAGRLGEDTGAEMLMSSSEEEAKNILTQLNLLNEKRKQLVIDITKKVSEIVDNNQLQKNNVIVVEGDFHEGVVGIIASKIAEKYGKSAIILSKEGTVYKGSGRSNGTMSLFDAVNKVKHLTEKFGGHAAAVGMTISEENIEEFKNELYKIEIEEHPKEIYYDMLFNFKNISVDLIKSFDILEPFGKENEKPVFLFKNVNVKKIYEREKMVSALFSQENKQIFGITFSKDLFKDIKENDTIYLLATLDINNYNNREDVQLQIIDMKKI